MRVREVVKRRAVETADKPVRIITDILPTVAEEARDVSLCILFFSLFANYSEAELLIAIISYDI